MRNSAWIFILTVAAVACFSSFALAAEAGEEHHFNWTDLILRITNIAIFAGVLYWLLRKPFKAFLTGRREKIQNQIENLNKRKADALARMDDVERRTNNLDQERESILAEYKAQGEAMRKAIIEKAEAAAEQIKTQARISAEQEARLAKERILAEAADQVLAQARAMLEDQLTKEKHEELIDKYLNRVVLN